MTNIYSQGHGIYLSVLIYCSGAFENCEKRLSASSCLSVSPHGTSPLLLDSFLWNFIFEYFS